MTFLIAEAGVNHGGKWDIALSLADAAKYAGADAVKYQLFSSQRLWGDDRIKHLELTKDEIEKVKTYCDDIGIEFICTPFDGWAVEFLEDLGVKRFKIASGCLTDYSLLYAVYQTGLPVILSTGMSTMDEIERALGTLAINVTLLHCTSSYPCKPKDVHLRAMDALGAFGRPVGLSDHTKGINVAIAAVARGATVIEKHLTMSKNHVGPDQESSITPEEFKSLRLACDEVEAALGVREKKVLPCEEGLRKLWRSRGKAY